jgi:quinol monooxygenase YgiN
MTPLPRIFAASMLGAAAVAIGIALTGIAPVSAQDATIRAGQPAAFIPMPAAEGQADAFAGYLESAAVTVRETEPGTTYWFGLRDAETVAIFDVFTDEAARQAHFEGDVAGAIEDNAGAWVEGGWDDGVVPNVDNAIILSARQPIDLGRATQATHIALTAAPGRADALADLLTAGGAIIEETEPGTLFWVALRYDENRFGIFDVFADEAGRAAHFDGQVAARLNERAGELVEGGWDAGIVANIRNFDVIAQR